MYLNEKEALELFAGTGENNKNGEDLKTFLEGYDASKYQNPCNTVDTLVFTYKEDKTISKVLLIKRGNHPSIGWWALPGGFVEFREDIADAALRELKEETGIENIEAEQLKTYGAYDRDPRTRIITTAYIALVPEGSLKAKAGDDASDSDWFDIRDEMLGQSQAEDGMMQEEHKLMLTNGSGSVCTESLVTITWKPDAFLPNKTYRTKQTHLLASDHSAIVLEGYHYLCGRLAGRP